MSIPNQQYLFSLCFSYAVKVTYTCTVHLSQSIDSVKKRHTFNRNYISLYWFHPVKQNQYFFFTYTELLLFPNSKWRKISRLHTLFLLNYPIYLNQCHASIGTEGYTLWWFIISPHSHIFAYSIPLFLPHNSSPLSAFAPESFGHYGFQNYCWIYGTHTTTHLVRTS